MFKTSNSYSKYVAAFIAFAFTLIQGVDFVLLKMGVKSNYLPYLLIVLLFAFLVGLFFVWKNQKRKAPSVVSSPKRKWTLYLNILATLVLGALFVYYFQKGRTDESLLNEKLPEIVSAYDSDALDIVYTETKKLLDEGNTNPIILNYYEKVTTPVSIFTDQDGVEVYFSQPRDTTEHTYALGIAPLNNVRVPNGVLKMTFKKGSATYSEFVHPYYLSNEYNNFLLPVNDSIPKNHILLVGGKKPLSYPGIDHLPGIDIKPYSISKYEVTNKEYKEFVDAGGYEMPEYWDFPYEIDGKQLTFETTVKTFVDAFGQPGPAVWQYGSYPEGQANFPVTGISWFEARAYAKYKGLSLPNLYQWANAAMLSWASSFVPKSNFSKNQLVDVGSMESQNPRELFDIAGNAREWIINAIDNSQSKRGILGGGYKDDPYFFNDYYGQQVMDRSASNGMRLVKNLECTSVVDTSPEEVVAIATRDFLNEETISDEVFEIFKAQYDYPDHPLNAKVTNTTISSGSLKADRFEISLPYDGEGILPGYVFYDSSYNKPYKPIIFFPGSNAIHLTNVDYMLKSTLTNFRYLLNEGYAIFQPIYISTYERVDDIKSDYPDDSDKYKEHVIKWGKEYKRTIDYIVSRDDMDSANLSYFGVSWGGFMSNTLLAIDDRVQIAVLYVAGLCFQKSKKEVEAYLYTPRITMPVLMLNGEFDQFFPLETSQIPMYKLLGTPEEDKKHYVSKTGHFVPKEVLISEHLGWLKKYEK